MARPTGLTRRVVVALGLAVALAIMHGGVGQAMACTGMSSTSAMDMRSGSARPAVDRLAAGEHAQRDQPADQPVSARGGQMCVSTPAVNGAGGGKAGPASIGLVGVPTPPLFDQPLISIAATGREPPAPDPVSELCVIRI